MLIAYIVTVVVSFILDIADRIVRKTSYTDGFSLFMSVVISFTPMLNLIFAYISVTEVANYYGKINNEKKEKLKEYNRFMECNSCKVIVRNGYIIENNKCPLCNNYGHKEILEEDYIPNKNIPEQSYISHIKKFREGKLLKKSDEQEELYLKALEQKLKNKNN